MEVSSSETGMPNVPIAQLYFESNSEFLLKQYQSALAKRIAFESSLPTIQSQPTVHPPALLLLRPKFPPRPLPIPKHRPAAFYPA